MMLPGITTEPLRLRLRLRLYSSSQAQTLSSPALIGTPSVQWGWPVSKDNPENLISQLRSLHRFLTAKEVAKLLNCHTETIYKKIKHQGLPTTRDVGRWKIDPHRLADWIEKRSA
jgi:excisionase family DNA binding protein